AVGKVPRVDGRDVDVEGGIVFRDAGPDFADRGDFIGAERRRVPVLIENAGDDVVVRTPGTFGVAVKIEIKLDPRSAVAGKLRQRRERAAGRRTGGAGGCRLGDVGRKQAFQALTGADRA